MHGFWFLSEHLRSLLEILFMHSSLDCDPGDGCGSVDLLSHPRTPGLRMTQTKSEC